MGTEKWPMADARVVRWGRMCVGSGRNRTNGTDRMNRRGLSRCALWCKLGRRLIGADGTWWGTWVGLAACLLRDGRAALEYGRWDERADGT